MSHDADDGSVTDGTPSGASVLFGTGDGTGDSAGQPWAGRSFSPNSFVMDTGEISKELSQAFQDFNTGQTGQGGLVDALAGQRLLVPIVAAAGETGTNSDGRTVDKSQELSLVTVQGPDGRPVLLAFTSVEAMTRWSHSARPIPVDSRRVALAAAAEGTNLVVLDAGSPTEFVLRRNAIRALGLGETWTPPWLDDAVVEAFSDSIAGVEAVLGIDIASGDPRSTLEGPEVNVLLTLVPALDSDGVREAVEAVQGRWRENAIILEQVESIGIRIRAAD